MIPDIIVGGVGGRSPGISHPGAHYAVQKPEPGVRSPESPEGESRRFQPAGHIPVEGRNLRRERLSREKNKGCNQNRFQKFHVLHLPFLFAGFILHYRSLIFAGKSFP